MKKLLPVSITAAIAVSALIFAFDSADSTRNYTPRQLSASQAVPASAMEWAKVNIHTGEFDAHAAIDVKHEIMNNPARDGEVGLTFESLGPDNVGGRTRAILEVFGKPDTMLVGSVSGGMFISYNGGGTWTPHTQFQNLDSSSSIISCIHQDTVNGHIYVGTGNSFDGNLTDWAGYGIYVSTDNGITFQHLSSTTPNNRLTTGGDPWLYVNRIRTDGEGNVYAATGRGLKRSIDFGETWEDVIFIGGQGSNSIFADVAASKSGQVVASTKSGAIYISEDGTPESFVQVSQSGMPTSGLGRTVLAVSAQDEDHMYVMMIASNSCLNSIWESTNGGDFWTKILVPHDDFNPMFNGDYCQGIYDAAFGVSPINDELLFIGGITMWRFDGNLTRVASEFGSPPFQDVLPNYVHADKHYVYFSPNNPGRVYVTSDGGVAMSENDGQTWQGLNKGYHSIQPYGIAHGNEGDIVLGGTQDNGTLIVLGDNPADPKVGFSMSGGDGFDCEMSQISEIVITTSQNGAVFRIDAGQRNGSNFPVGTISSATGNGLFYTRVKLWENNNDPTSRDSVTFTVNSSEIAFDVSNGVVKNYTANIDPVQPAAIVVANSIEVFSGTQRMVVSNDDSTILEGVNNTSSGTINYREDGSFDLAVSFENAPSENSNIYVKFDQRFKANDILILESNNLNSGLSSYEFEYRLEYDLNPGDEIKVQDPVQSILASTGGANASGGVRLYRNVLNFTAIPQAIDIPGISGSVSCMEFTSDGNTLFVGTMNGQVYRISGLQNFYTADDLNQLEITTLSGASVGAGGITGLALDPNDDNRLVVTAGGYGGSDRVKISTNALGAATFANIHSNLARMPIYDAVIDRNNPDIIVLGTEFGIWATANASDPVPTWGDENDNNTYVPVYSVRQQSLPWELAKNTGVYYFGTYGRGFYKSGSLVGIDDIDPLPANESSISGLKVFPNPVQTEAKIEFNTNFTGMAEVALYDINGRQIRNWQERVVSGQNYITIDASLMRTGHYIATVSAGGSQSAAKIMVLK